MRLSTGTVAPFALTVPALSASTLTTSGQRRLPGGISYSVSIHTANGVGVVAERTETSSGGVVTSRLPGAPQVARTWLVSAPAAGSLVLQDPGRSNANVSVARVTGGKVHPVPGLARVTVAASRTKTVSVPGSSQGLVLVQASRPLVAEWVTTDSGRALPAIAVSVPSS
jgi:hypothetical protein